jgi:hypothetical protein
VAHLGDRREGYRVLVGKFGEKRLPERSRRKCEENIKNNLKIV